MDKAADKTIGRTAGRAMRSFACHFLAVAACFSLPALIAPAAMAATGNVVFNGTISTNNSCAVLVQQDGTLGVKSDFRQLSSKIAGGAPGIADVIAVGNYNLSAITPSVFAVGPSAANTGVTRKVLYSSANLLGGGAAFAERDGSIPAPVTGLSWSRVTMNFDATRTGTTFPSGHYEALVVLRCE